MDENKSLEVEKKIKPGYKDYIAIAIAIFEIIAPIVLIGILIFAVILFLITKVWFR